MEKSATGKVREIQITLAKAVSVSRDGVAEVDLSVCTQGQRGVGAQLASSTA